MKAALLCLILLSGCAVRLVDDRVDPAQIAQILNQQSAAITAIGERVTAIEKGKK